MFAGHHSKRTGLLAVAASLALAVLGGLSFTAEPVAASTSRSPVGAAVTCTRGDVTVFGVRSDARTITVSTLKDPTSGGPSTPAVVVAKLPFAVKAIGAITASTIFVTDAKGVLYELDLTRSPNGKVNASRHKLATGWTYDRIAYDGQDHVFGLASGKLYRHGLGTTPLSDTGTPVAGSASGLAGGFVVDSAQSLGSGFAYKTLAGVGDEWLLATTADGEWDEVEVTGDPTLAVTRHVLGFSPRIYADLVATAGGVYYGRGADGSLTWFTDGDPLSGTGTGIAGGKRIDASGWDQLQISAVPATCGADFTALDGSAAGIAQDGPRTIGRTRSYNGFGAGWCTQGAHEMFHRATGMWMDIHGHAWSWADSARRAGWTVVSTPQPRSVIVFGPNVQINRDHAGALGHVAWVETVQTRASGIWMFIREMNAAAGRGGWDSRWIKYNPSISAATQEPANQFILAP